MPHITVATANMYYLPFSQALKVIAEAGFQTIELDLFWQYKNWAMAQHLEGVSVHEIRASIQAAGLTVHSVHDGGGVLDAPSSNAAYINPNLAPLLAELQEPPEMIIFHTPHLEEPIPFTWWGNQQQALVAAAKQYQTPQTQITLENMLSFDGFYVPLLPPQELRNFADQHQIGVTLDTTHYAQMGVDIVQAARILRGKVLSLHLSDFCNGKAHVFPGDGELPWPAFFAELDPACLRTITIESSAGRLGEDVRQLTPRQMVERLQLARERVEEWLQ